MDNEYTREAVKYMEQAAYTRDQLDEYYNRKIDAMTERSTLIDARKEGKIEGKIEVAKNLIKKGMSIEDVSDATGLSKQQIEELTKL